MTEYASPHLERYSMTHSADSKTVLEFVSEMRTSLCLDIASGTRSLHKRAGQVPYAIRDMASNSETSAVGGFSRGFMSRFSVDADVFSNTGLDTVV